MRQLVVVLVVLAPASACFPVIAHPTRVERGLQFGAFVSGGLAKDSSVVATNQNYKILPSVDFELSLETRDTLRANSLGLRLAANAGLGAVGASVYAELPRSWMHNVDAGFGYLVNRGYQKSHGPYAQFGKQGTTGSWFVRNGIVRTSAYTWGTSSLVWIPLLGTSSRHASGDQTTFYVAGIVGAKTPASYGCPHFDCSANPNGFTRTYVVLGASRTYRLAR